MIHMSENPMVHDPNNTSAEWLHEGVEKARAEDYKKIVDTKHAWAERIAKLLNRDIDDIWDTVYTMPASSIQSDYETLTYYLPQEGYAPNMGTPDDFQTAFAAGVAALLGVTGLGLEVMLIEAGFTLQLSSAADQIITLAILVGILAVGGLGITYLLRWISHIFTRRFKK